MRFVAPVTIDCASDGEPRRTITGVAVPWDTPTFDSAGQAVKFQRDSLPTDGRNPKLLEGHDPTQIRGLVTERVSTDDGLLFTAKIADTNAGRDTMQLLLMGAVDAVSVGVNPTKFHYDTDGVMVIESATFNELSLVAFPAFDEARISTVAASQPTNTESEPTMSEAPAIETAQPATQATVPTQPLFAEPRREFKLPSMGEYIAAFVEGGHRFAQMNDNIRKFAAPDVVTTDIPGVLPISTSAVYNNYRGLRPVVDAVTVRAMPQAGKVFIRPVVTTHNSIGAVTEGTTIQASTFVVDDVQITKGIYGGYTELSEASLDWSSPEVLNALLDDMARVYANQTDDVACTELESGTTNTNNFTAASIADPAYWVEWIYTAAADILTASNGNLPTHLFLSPVAWKNLGLLSDTADRPLFPQVGPMNAFGQVSPGQSTGNAFGLTVVVDRNLTNTGNGTVIIGHPDGFECWEQTKGVVSIENPSLLARTIAYRGYFAPKMIDDSKFIKAAFV